MTTIALSVGRLDARLMDKDEIFKEALEKIAYPANWPSLAEYHLSLDSWMQSVAANALTEGRKIDG